MQSQLQSLATYFYHRVYVKYVYKDSTLRMVI
jgi:hypothetical protein